jgi:hypothetical protein
VQNVHAYLRLLNYDVPYTLSFLHVWASSENAFHRNGTISKRKAVVCFKNKASLFFESHQPQTPKGASAELPWKQNLSIPEENVCLNMST